MACASRCSAPVLPFHSSLPTQERALTHVSPDPIAAPTTATSSNSGTYKWVVVGMLWFICFFNYADRQAISSILPVLQDQYGFSKEEQGQIVSAFMWVYALTAPFAGQVGDRFAQAGDPRRTLCLERRYRLHRALHQGLAVPTRAGAEGLGETFYFPASMSLVSDYHAQDTLASHEHPPDQRLCRHHRRRSIRGLDGRALRLAVPICHSRWSGRRARLVLAAFIREPRRNQAELSERGVGTPDDSMPPAAQMPLGEFFLTLLRTPTALALVFAFFGANMVGLIFLSWMPTFMKEKFELSLALAGLGATLFIQIGSMVGSVVGGLLADRWKHRLPGGRMMVQGLGLLCGTPFIFLCGQTAEFRVLVVVLTLFGLFKGLYDANIWASLYDVVPASRRSTAVGLTNMIGWLGAAFGTQYLGRIVDSGITMSVAIASTAVIYLLMAAVLLLAAFLLAPRDIRRAEAAASTAAD